MKTIKSLKELTTLQVGDKVLFGDLEYEVHHNDGYFLYGLGSNNKNDKIFTILGFPAIDFVKNLGIEPLSVSWIFPEVKSLEALTALVSALFKEYEKQNELPKTWEEFCKKYPLKEEETFINSASKPIIIGDYIERRYRVSDTDKNLCISKKEAQAFIALMQLRQLRKAYIKDWEPDWEDIYKDKSCVGFCQNELVVLERYDSSCPLSFPTEELATQFLTYFKDLLEIAKPLL